MLRLLVLSVLVACSSASYHTVKMVNRSPHTIESIYVYDVGAQNHGASRGSLAPNGTLEVKVKSGNVEVLATTKSETIDEKLRERKEASQVLELRGPIELVFHNSDQPIVDRPGMIGLVFRVLAKPAAEEPSVEPAPHDAPNE